IHLVPLPSLPLPMAIFPPLHDRLASLQLSKAYWDCCSSASLSPRSTAEFRKDKMHQYSAQPLLSTVPENVEAVVLFGSSSRGDADHRSDIDLAVFAHAALSADLMHVKNSLRLSAGSQLPISLSVYSVATAEQMANDGSLFLWHLKHESTLLFQRNSWYAVLLEHLVPYSAVKAARDLETFERTIQDIRLSLAHADSPLLFETSTMHSVLRSLGMITSMVDGNPTFRRNEPIRYLKRFVGERFAVTQTQLD